MANVEGKNECESEILGGGVEIFGRGEFALHYCGFFFIFALVYFDVSLNYGRNEKFGETDRHLWNQQYLR